MLNSRKWLRIHDFYDYFTDVASTEDPKYANVPEVSGSKKVGIGLHLGARMFVDDDERHMPQNPVQDLDCLLFGEGGRRDIQPHIIIAKDWNAVIKYVRENYMGGVQIN